MFSILDTMRDEIYASSVSSNNTTIQESPVADLLIKESPVDKLPVPSIDVPRSSVSEVTPVRSLTPANRNLRFLETGAPGSPHIHTVSSRAAVTVIYRPSTNGPACSPRRPVCS